MDLYHANEFFPYVGMFVLCDHNAGSVYLLSISIRDVEGDTVRPWNNIARDLEPPQSGVSASVLRYKYTSHE